jgi:glyoxylate utilization-related uncharacterized protein
MAEMVELTAAAFTFEESATGICGFLHVLEASLRLVTDGMTQTFSAGDCAYMETRMSTSLNAEGKERCRILLVRPAPSL